VIEKDKDNVYIALLKQKSLADQDQEIGDKVYMKFIVNQGSILYTALAIYVSTRNISFVSKRKWQQPNTEA
jgi:hypothetical protein